MVTFKKAERAATHLKMALDGPTGSGKTFTALGIASVLAEGQKIAVADTERGKSALYADRFDFDMIDFREEFAQSEMPFHPDNVVRVVEEAVRGGYAVLILDSLSHFWFGKGGVLEQVELIAKRSCRNNTFQAWGAGGTAMQNRMVDALLEAPIHIICTLRTKTAYDTSTGADGKMKPQKVGKEPVQREGLEYEFDIIGDMDQDNTLIVSKTRCMELTGAVVNKPGLKFAEAILAWCKSGKARAPRAAAASQSPARQDQPQVRPSSPGREYQPPARQEPQPPQERTAPAASPEPPPATHPPSQPPATGPLASAKPPTAAATQPANADPGAETHSQRVTRLCSIARNADEALFTADEFKAWMAAQGAAGHRDVTARMADMLEAEIAKRRAARAQTEPASPVDTAADYF